jgi:tetratricopeptide (TPR) repeat protein
VEKEFRKLMMDDDTAQTEVDGWIRENESFADKGGGIPAKELNARIRNRFESVKKGYEDFIALHPNHVRVRLAYGSFLNDIRQEDDAVVQFEKARELDPKNATAWNQLANYYGHDGPVKKAFEYYAKAIELNPTESIYYQNLGTTVFMFRKDAMEFYHINEQEVFNKALSLYEQAMKHDPDSFELAQDVAQTYYGIRPPRTEDALKAWTNALNLAQAPLEREGVYLHMARWKLNAGRFAETHQLLSMVSNPMYNDLKARLLRNLKAREENPNGTNAPAAKIELKQSSEPNTSTNKP